MPVRKRRREDAENVGKGMIGHIQHLAEIYYIVMPGATVIMRV
jgi:hypothetical protein